MKAYVRDEMPKENLQKSLSKAYDYFEATFLILVI